MFPLYFYSPIQMIKHNLVVFLKKNFKNSSLCESIEQMMIAELNVASNTMEGLTRLDITSAIVPLSRSHTKLKLELVHNKIQPQGIIESDDLF